MSNTSAFVSVQSQKNAAGSYGYPSAMFICRYGETSSHMMTDNHESSFATSDSNGYVCVYGTGSQVRIRNRMGATNGISVQGISYYGN